MQVKTATVTYWASPKAVRKINRAGAGSYRVKSWRRKKEITPLATWSYFYNSIAGASYKYLEIRIWPEFGLKMAK